MNKLALVKRKIECDDCHEVKIILIDPDIKMGSFVCNRCFHKRRGKVKKGIYKLKLDRNKVKC